MTLVQRALIPVSELAAPSLTSPSAEAVGRRTTGNGQGDWDGSASVDRTTAGFGPPGSGSLASAPRTERAFAFRLALSAEPSRVERSFEIALLGTNGRLSIW